MTADFTIKANDTAPSIQATLASNGVAVNLTGATVKFIMTATVGGTVKVAANGVLVDAANGIVRYDWIPTDTNAPNNYEAEWEVVYSSGKKQTFPTLTYHTVTVLADLNNA